MIKEEQKIRFIKSLKNPSAFYENNFFIYNNEKGRHVYSKLYKEQKEFLNMIDKTNQLCVLKSRGAGATSILALYVAKILLFHFDKNISFISGGGVISNTNFISQVQTILEQSEFFEINKLLVRNKKMLVYNGSSLRIHGDSKDSLRGYTSDILIIDEASYLKNLANIWYSSIPVAVARGGKFIFTSSNYKSSSLLKAIFDTSYNDQVKYKRMLLLEKKESSNSYIDSNLKFFKYFH